MRINKTNKNAFEDLQALSVDDVPTIMELHELAQGLVKNDEVKAAGIVSGIAVPGFMDNDDDDLSHLIAGEAESFTDTLKQPDASKRKGRPKAKASAGGSLGSAAPGTPASASAATTPARGGRRGGAAAVASPAAGEGFRRIAFAGARADKSSSIDLEYQKWGFGQAPKISGAKKSLFHGTIDEISAIDLQRRVDASDRLGEIFGLLMPGKGQTRAGTLAVHGTFHEKMSALHGLSERCGLYIARRWTARVGEQCLMQKNVALAVLVMAPCKRDGVAFDGDHGATNLATWDWEAPRMSLLIPQVQDEEKAIETEEPEPPEITDSPEYIAWAQGNAWRQDVKHFGAFVYEMFACEAFFHAHKTDEYFDTFVEYTRAWGDEEATFGDESDEKDDHASGLKASSAVVNAMQNIQDACRAVLAVYNVQGGPATADSIAAFHKAFNNRRQGKAGESAAFWTRLSSGLRLSPRWKQAEKEFMRCADTEVQLAAKLEACPKMDFDETSRFTQTTTCRDLMMKNVRPEVLKRPVRGMITTLQTEVRIIEDIPKEQRQAPTTIQTLNAVIEAYEVLSTLQDVHGTCSEASAVAKKLLSATHARAAAATLLDRASRNFDATATTGKEVYLEDSEAALLFNNIDRSDKESLEHISEVMGQLAEDFEEQLEQIAKKGTFKSSTADSELRPEAMDIALGTYTAWHGLLELAAPASFEKAVPAATLATFLSLTKDVVSSYNTYLQSKGAANWNTFHGHMLNVLRHSQDEFEGPTGINVLAKAFVKDGALHKIATLHDESAKKFAEAKGMELKNACDTLELTARGLKDCTSWKATITSDMTLGQVMELARSTLLSGPGQTAKTTPDKLDTVTS